MYDLPPAPEINRRGPVPPHRIVADWLREQIAAGQWQPMEDPLPSEMDLSEHVQVARDTVRRAIKVLRDEGLVITVAQRGTYVTEDAVPSKSRQRRR
jgi:DNA-binding GntR family transcriptional regulator